MTWNLLTKLVTLANRTSGASDLCLFPCLMWPLTSYEVLVTKLEKLEQLLSYDIFPSPKILASGMEEIHMLALLITINTEADIG